MPITQQYLDRCVRENAMDADTFYKYYRVVVYRPTSILLKALRKKRPKLETSVPKHASKRQRIDL